jgi:hypothetical protein
VWLDALVHTCAPPEYVSVATTVESWQHRHQSHGTCDIQSPDLVERVARVLAAPGISMLWGSWDAAPAKALYMDQAASVLRYLQTQNLLKREGE